jgi:hypothetical protein
MAAFEGAPNPSVAIESGYYVHAPGKSVDNISNRIAVRPSSSHLLLGGISSGKTTQFKQLNRDVRKLRKQSVSGFL